MRATDEHQTCWCVATVIPSINVFQRLETKTELLHPVGHDRRIIIQQMFVHITKLIFQRHSSNELFAHQLVWSAPTKGHTRIRQDPQRAPMKFSPARPPPVKWSVQQIELPRRISNELHIQMRYVGDGHCVAKPSGDLLAWDRGITLSHIDATDE